LGLEVADADELSVPINRRLARDEEQLADPVALSEPEGLLRIGVDRDLLDLHRRSPSLSRAM
jgi:hypothetical protein